MGLIVKYHTFVDGAGVPNAQCLAVRLNTNWDRLYTLVNGNIDQNNAYTGYKFTRSGALPAWSAAYEGVLWYDTGADLVYYGNASAWVAAIGPQGPTGHTGPAGTAGTAGTAGAGSAFRTYTWVIMYPVAGEVYGVNLYEAHAWRKITACTTGGTSVAFNIEERNEATPGTTGVNLMPADLTADSNSATYVFNGGSAENGSSDATDWMVIDITTVTGVVTQLAISLAGEIV